MNHEEKHEEKYRSPWTLVLRFGLVVAALLIWMFLLTRP
jgi:hypothetical protein